MNAANPYGDVSHVLHNDSSSILMDAKKELQKEKTLLDTLKNQRAQNSNASNNKDGDDNDIDDTENGQESMSEDESGDDSDRKGMAMTKL